MKRCKSNLYEEIRPTDLPTMDRTLKGKGFHVSPVHSQCSCSRVSVSFLRLDCRRFRPPETVLHSCFAAGIVSNVPPTTVLPIPPGSALATERSATRALGVDGEVGLPRDSAIGQPPLHGKTEANGDTTLSSCYKSKARIEAFGGNCLLAWCRLGYGVFVGRRQVRETAKFRLPFSHSMRMTTMTFLTSCIRRNAARDLGIAQHFCQNIESRKLNPW